MEYHRNTVYAILVDNYVRASEARRTGKSHKFIDISLRSMGDDEREALMRQYNIAPHVSGLISSAKRRVDEMIAQGHGGLTSFEVETVMTGLEHCDIVPMSKNSESIDLYFGDFIRTMKAVAFEYDYTAFAHEIFTRTYTSRIRQVHQNFELEPENMRYRYLGPILASPDDAEAYNELFMRIILEIVERPYDPEDFLCSYRDAFIDYHLEYVGAELNELGISDALDGLDDFVALLSDPELSYRMNGGRYRPICRLSPALCSKELAHVVDYFDEPIARRVAQQHYDCHFSQLYYDAASLLF